MKRLIIISLSVLSLCSCSLLSEIQWNPEGLASAAGKTITAASISDQQVVALCQQTVVSLDKENTLAGNDYQKRLERLMGGIEDIDGVPVNYKVYKTDEINAFACGDGSIRVYSGLMDVMDDQEVVAIIGHELGHVMNQDTKKALKNAYIASAARDVIGSAGSYGALISSLLGDLGEALVSAQFSQAQEYKADQHGFQFAIDMGYSPRSMEKALIKLLTISGSGSDSIMAHMFASHPQTEKRIERVQKAAEEYEAKAAKASR